MSSPLEVLHRTDRYELADNRMTLYAPGFGLGSVHYWDGSWDNDEDEIPYQSREVFENHDGGLEVLLASGEVDVLQKDRHEWQPHQINSRYVGTHQIVWQETKTIHNDTAVSLVTARGSGLRSREITIRHRIASTPQLQIKPIQNGVLLLAREGRYAGIHRFIGFAPLSRSGKAKTRIVEAGQHAYLEMKWTVPHEANTQFAFIVAAGENKKEAEARYRAALQNPQATLQNAEQRWQEYFGRHVPEFSCDNEKWTKLYYFACYVLRANLYDFQKGAIQHPYSCPSKWRLLPSWFWDPCFHGFAEKWLRDYPAPLSTFRNHIGAQEADGYLPMTLDHRGNTWKAMGAGARQCQAFLHPITVWDYYLVHGDKSVLREMLEPLARHDRFIGKERETDELFVPRGGGELADNSSRLVANISERDQISTLGQSIQPIDWNTYQYVSERMLARMAREIARDDLEKEMTARADAKAKALRQLWNESTRLFADRVLPKGELSHKKIPESLVALFGGYANRSQIKNAIAFLTDPHELWTKYPVPTLPLSDPQFTADDSYASYWNGRVWPPLNWVCIEGLFRAGQTSVGKELLHRNLEMSVCAGEAHLMENFNPLEASRYAPPHCIFNQSWSALAIDLILRRGLGLQLNAPGGEVSLQPQGLPQATEASVEGVPFGNDTLDITVSFRPSKAKVRGKAKQVGDRQHWLEI
jgi:hypothetical protein